MRCSITLCQFGKKAQENCAAVATGNLLICYPFNHYACSNGELLTTLSLLAIYRWEKFI